LRGNDVDVLVHVIRYLYNSHESSPQKGFQPLHVSAFKTRESGPAMI